VIVSGPSSATGHLRFGVGQRSHPTSACDDAIVEAHVISRAHAATTSLGVDLGLSVVDAVVIHNSNKLALRLLPCDVFARVAPAGQEVASLEVELARTLTSNGCPIASLEPRVGGQVYERDGFAITFWTYYPPATLGEISPAAYADALQRLHAGMRGVKTATPHFTDRVSEAEQLVASSELTPNLEDADRDLLSTTLLDARRVVETSSAAEQLLHGEPHPGNVLSTASGPVFIDLETCCRGPVEFDLAHVPDDVAARYPNADNDLLRECRRLVLAMVGAWRFDAHDEFPDGRRAGQEILSALRAGPPWPTLDLLDGRG